ncbi:MAG: protein-L-isoaspartate(D-aspartate) O-methyltransferase [Gemmatimonadota bacterium]|nr:protein-L-isoaspartate(D-aspartate) O-methyltransferase [Gemmatimonadota bacterium]
MDPGAVAGAYRHSRRRLVEALAAGGIEDLAVLHAFHAVPRHLFVPEAVRHRAYEDAALPLGHGQTISRPAVHAAFLQLAGLQGHERVLEIGTGSGFQTALLATLAREVCTVEVVPALADEARRAVTALGFENVSFLTGDGSAGWPARAPFDVILVGAAAPEVPAALQEQLAVGGRLLIPVGDTRRQVLLQVDRTGDGWSTREVEPARFVPLVGEGGW